MTEKAEDWYIILQSPSANTQYGVRLGSVATVRA